MEKTFTVSYGYKTFGGMIGAGVMEYEADSIESIQEAAFKEVLKRLEFNNDDEDKSHVYDFQNLSISVTEK